MDERLERVYARWCARSVLHLWDTPEVVRRWVDEGEEGLREVARDAARDAARAAWAAEAGSAAGDAARAASTAAAGDAAEPRVSAAWAAWAEGAAAEVEAARAAAWAKQSRTIDLLGLLPDLLRTHGLAARLLDDAREDPWLTREVVRALALPDLAVWCDWYKQMENNQ